MIALPDLSKVIRLSIDEDGHVTDDASPELKQIRQSIRRSEQAVREQLDGILRGKNSNYLSDTIVTMRNDRYVIPVKVSIAVILVVLFMIKVHLVKQFLLSQGK